MMEESGSSSAWLLLPRASFAGLAGGPRPDPDDDVMESYDTEIGARAAGAGRKDAKVAKVKTEARRPQPRPPLRYALAPVLQRLAACLPGRPRACLRGW